jgi:hypothetical protein
MALEVGEARLWIEQVRARAGAPACMEWIVGSADATAMAPFSVAL